MGQVNRYPQGLLGLLQAKQLGATPAQSAPNLQYGIDLEKYYLSGSGLYITTESYSGAVTVGDQYATITIPDGQTWAVLGVAAVATYVNASDQARMFPAISSIREDVSGSLTDGAMLLGDSAQFNTTAAGGGESIAAGYWFAQPIIMRPPGKFAVFIGKAILVAGIGVETQVIHYILER